ncbi:DUF6315 family protein [Mycolicibacterium vaccae]|uniref:DUF6315 family protein n=2 Tax=Mycolicibacterium vaccae TaxID=1810 RepID=UPI0036F35B4E
MRENSATSEIHPALNHRCPFCHAGPAEPCRTRNSGRQQDWPHSRRIALTTPQDERRPAKRVSALCCVCGNQRTVSSDYSRYQDPNHSSSVEGKAKGWRKTETLKCDACGARTRHALLNNGHYRDWDERIQSIALGGNHPAAGWSEESVQCIRREYRELYPRNPYLHHRRYTADAQKAWDDGTKRVIARCGEPIEVKVDPRQAAKYSEPNRKVGSSPATWCTTSSCDSSW